MPPASAAPIRPGTHLTAFFVEAKKPARDIRDHSTITRRPLRPECDTTLDFVQELENPGMFVQLGARIISSNPIAPYAYQNH